MDFWEAHVRILVTGGAGYVGTVLTIRLLAAEHDVRIVDNLASYSDETPPLMPENAELVRGDVRDLQLMKRAVQDCDAVVHLAALVGYPACAANPTEARSTNIEGTETVLQAASDRLVVFVSSLSCLGDIGGRECDETVVPKPASLYGMTKLLGEERVLARDNTVVLRPATAFGRSPRMRLDLLVHQLVSDALRAGQIQVYEPGNVRCFVHVEDFASAILHALERPDRMRGDVFHVGNSELNMTKFELANAISRIIPCNISVDESDHDEDHRNYGSTFAKLSRTGFTPGRGIELGIKEVASFLMD